MKPACLVLALAAGCVGPEYDSVRIGGPAVIDTEQFALLKLRAYGESSGEQVDITRDVTWRTMNSDIANVTDDGTVMVTDSGFVHICAILDADLRATVAIHSVTPPPQAAP